MYVDYDFYTSIYGGSKLEEDSFNKFIEKSENTISIYTFDRVNANTLSSFPLALITKIKKCACELAEYEYDVDGINKLISVQDNGTTGLVKSITAGAVSKTYDTTSAINNLSSSSNNAVRTKTILGSWLYPQYIASRYYNLLSWVI